MILQGLSFLNTMSPLKALVIYGYLMPITVPLGNLAYTSLFFIPAFN